MSRLATLIACTLLLSGCTALQIGKPTKSVETPFTLPELWVQSNEGSEGEINLMVYPGLNQVGGGELIVLTVAYDEFRNRLCQQVQRFVFLVGKGAMLRQPHHTQVDNIAAV